MSSLPKVSLLSLCLVVSSIYSSRDTVAENKPNIIVIVSDDSGYNEFTMNGGNRLFPTPRIDSIAANGVRFPNGYVSGTVCSPTRAGLLTGRYQNRFGHEFNVPPVYSEDNGLSLKETTIADVLKSADYRTIALGKWHLGYAPKFHPMQRGFTDYYGFLQGARSYFPLKKSNNLNQLLRDREPAPETFDYMTDELGRAAADYIAKSKGKPFFIYLAYNATHGPNEATDADLATVKGGGGNEVHRAMSLALDRSVGLVLDELQRNSLTENTLIFYINDNGGVSGHDNAPLRGFKGSTWEGGTRIPFAIQWPAVLPRGKVFEAPVISLDIFPTAMAAAGVKTSPGNPLDGVNLIPYLLNETKGRPHQTLYWKNGTKWAVRDGDLKAVFGNTEGQGKKKNKVKDVEAKKPSTEIALFDLSKDGSETNNLAASRADEVARLEKLYNEWKKDFPKPTWGGGEK